MRYNVAQLLKRPTGTQRQYDLDEEIRHLDPELEPVDSLSGSVTLMRSSHGILVLGTLRTRLRVECRRCLEPHDVDIGLDLEEEFYPTVPIRDVPVDEVPGEEWDQALLIDAHQILDLSETLRQELLLAVPRQTLCRPDCAGLCPTCGESRNTGECHCDEAPMDVRWAALQALLAEEPDSKERRD
jgi:uncharacterized protein